MVVGGLFYLLNVLYPLFADDYIFCYIYGTNERIMSVGDLIKSQYLSYLKWIGRTPAIFILQFFLWKGKYLFNILNSIVFVCLIILAYKNLSSSSKKENKIKTYIFLVFLLWFGIPEFGETTIWMTGSAVYLWMSIFLLIYVYLLKKITYEKIKMRKIYILPLFVLGILSGWTNENCVIAVIIVTIYIIFFQKKMNIYNLFLFLGFILGACLLILAPGNFVRAGVVNHEPSILKWLTSYSRDFIKIIKAQGIIWISLISMLFYLKKKKRNILKVLIEFKLELFLFIFSMLAMLASPIFPKRSSFGATIFLIIFTTNVFTVVLELVKKKNMKKIYYTIILILSLSYIFVLKDYIILKQFSNEREELIYNSDKKNVVVPRLENANNYMLVRDGSLKEEDFWVNESIEQYYNIERIIIIDRYIYDNVYKKNNLNENFYKIFDKEFRLTDFLTVKKIYIAETKEKHNKIILLNFLENNDFDINYTKLKMELKYKKSNQKLKTKNYECDFNLIKMQNENYLICKIVVWSSKLETINFSLEKNGELVSDTITINNIVLDHNN